MVLRPAPLMQPTGDPPLLDPRRGDAEDDASSPKQRSLLAIAGSLLAEISLPKLLFAWTFSILLPALLLGLAPLIATAWLLKVSRAAAQITGARHGLCPFGRRRAGMDRMAAAVAAGGDQFLVA